MLASDVAKNFLSTLGTVQATERPDNAIYPASTEIIVAADQSACSICRGAGFLAWDVPVGDSRFGQLKPCECTVKRRLQRQADLIREHCRLPSEMQGWTFGHSADLSSQTDAMREARRLANDPKWFLTLTGGYGVGKSHILCCLVNQALEQGKVAVYLTMAELLENLKRGFDPSSGTEYDELWNLVVDAQVLALDELDRFNHTAWAESILFQVIETRYRAGDTRLTAFAMNCSVGDLPGYVASRMRDSRCRIFDLGDADLRRV
jgi:DNA replication protein DnaC